MASQTSKNAHYVPSGTGFKEQESILGFRRIRSENSSGSSSFSSRSLRPKRRRNPACTASFPSYDGASLRHLASSSFRETDHRIYYSCRTGPAQGSLGYQAAETAWSPSSSRPSADYKNSPPGELPLRGREKKRERPALRRPKWAGQNPNATSFGRLAAIPRTLDPEAPAGLILNAIGVSL